MEPCKTPGQHGLRSLTMGYCGCGYLNDLTYTPTEAHTATVTAQTPAQPTALPNGQPTALPKPSQPAASRTRV